MLWTVIAVLIIGSSIGGYFLIRHASNLEQTNTQLNGDNDSLRRQLVGAKSLAVPTPSPVATPSSTPTPSVIPTATPKSTPTPKTTPAPKPQP